MSLCATAEGRSFAVPAIVRDSTGLRRLRRRRLSPARIACAFCALTLLLMTGMFLNSKGLLPWSSDVVEIARFSATPRFTSLPPDKQRVYVKTMMDHRWELALAYKTGRLTRGEVHAAAANCWKVATAQYLEEYSSLSSPAAQEAFLDRTIDELDKSQLFRWASGAGLRCAPSKAKAVPLNPKRPRIADAAGAGSSPWMIPSRVKKLIETMPPVQRAQISAFYTAVLKRRAERIALSMR